MIDHEFRIFDNKYIDESIKIINWKYSKKELQNRIKIENQKKILIKNKITNVNLCSLPFENFENFKKNFFYQVNFKRELKIKSKIIVALPLLSNKKIKKYFIFMKNNIKNIDGIEFLFNLEKKNISIDEEKLFLQIKTILKLKKKLLIYFYPCSQIKIRPLRTLCISNLILRINNYNGYKNKFYIGLLGSGFDFYLNNYKYKSIFKNVFLINDVWPTPKKFLII